MLVRATGSIHPNYYLVSIGSACHYLALDHGKATIFDPGISGALPVLKRKIYDCGIEIEQIQKILLTHLHPERVGGVPYLLKLAKDAKLYVSPKMAQRLSDRSFVESLYREDLKLALSYQMRDQVPALSLEEYSELWQDSLPLTESQFLEVGEDLEIRAVSAPGHTEESMMYILSPYHYLIVDEGLGYFHGQELAAPGADFSIEAVVHTLKALKDHEISGISLPYIGTITGDLARNYLDNVLHNIQDIFDETLTAHLDGMSDDEIKAQVYAAFYTRESRDPGLRLALERSFNSLWEKVLSHRKNPQEFVTKDDRLATTELIQS